MNNHHATIIGHAGATAAEYSVLGRATNPGTAGNSNESAAQNHQKKLKIELFKEIASHIQNSGAVHVTGTGTAQEQFIHCLAETPRFKNTVARECTSYTTSYERVVEFISGKFN